MKKKTRFNWMINKKENNQKGERKWRHTGDGLCCDGLVLFFLSMIVITIIISIYAYMSFKPANYKFSYGSPIYNKARFLAWYSRCYISEILFSLDGRHIRTFFLLFFCFSSLFHFFGPIILSPVICYLLKKPTLKWPEITRCVQYGDSLFFVLFFGGDCDGNFQCYML